MAKQVKLQVGETVVINSALIHHFHEDNSRQDSFDNPLSDLGFSFDAPQNYNDSANKSKGLVRLLYNGWDVSQGIMKVITLETFARIRKTTVDEVVKSIEASRKQQLATWEADENTKGLANTMKMVWFPEGKMVVPLAIGNEGYRRSYAIAGVLYKRTLNPSFDGNLTFEIPVKVVDFADDLSRIISHAQENTLKDAGRSEYAPLDYLKLAVQIVRALGAEADLVKAGVKRGTAQKVHRVAQLDQKYPSVQLVERCFKRVPEEGAIAVYSPDCYIPLAKLDKEHIGRLLNGYWYNDNQKTTQIDVTSETVHKWLSDIIVGKVEKTPSMSGGDIGKLANHSCKIIQDIAKAIGANDSAFFANLTPYHEILDKAYAEVKKLQGKVSGEPAKEVESKS